MQLTNNKHTYTKKQQTTANLKKTNKQTTSKHPRDYQHDEPGKHNACVYRADWGGWAASQTLVIL